MRAAAVIILKSFEKQFFQFSFDLKSKFRFRRFNTNIYTGITFKRYLNLTKMTQTFEYPDARQDDKYQDDFFGTKVSDPYRWLEDPDAKDTNEYINANNNITKPFLDNCDQAKKINEKLTKLWNYEKYSSPARHGNNYFFYMNTGLQNQNVLYKQATLSSSPTVFLDPNTLSPDGTISLSGTSHSDDGNLFAYGLSESGSDWLKIKTRDVNTGKDFPEILENVKFTSMTWTKDNCGFFYCRYPIHAGKADGSETVANEHQKLYYHRVGDTQDKDVLVVEFPENPSWRIGADVSDCGKYLLLLIIKDCRDHLVFFSDLEKNGGIVGKLQLTQIVHKFEADYEYVTNTDSLFVFRTNKNAPNYRLVCIDFNQPEEANWKTLVEEDHKDVLDWAQCVHNDKIVIGYINDVKSVLQVHSLENGKFLRKFPIDIGTIVGFSGRKEYSEIFYNFTSFLTPGIIYYYDFAKPNVEPIVYREIKLKLDGFNSSDYKIEQQFYNSKDGTKVPMFIIQKNKPKDAKTDEPLPCLLYGYGGFNLSLQPTFSITGLMFIDTFNGILAFPNIRGGGEYGEKWHNAGRLFNKQNVFDDFHAAAEYLIENRYTVKDKLVIQGGSNGGLLVGACINQRPDLFGAAIIQVGVLDMLRFHKFTIGRAWTSDYGNADEEKHFFNLYKYSPLHNVKTPTSDAEQYPSTLILTADHDDRVSPLHSLKFTAALHRAIKDCPYQKNPLLLRVYNKAGHGAGKPTTKRIEEATDILTFMYKALNLNVKN